MNDIAFINNNNDRGMDRFVDLSISFKGYEEYLRLKDLEKNILREMTKAREKEQLTKFLADKAINSDKVSKVIEDTIGKVIQESFDKR